jgi:hypothetical protein
MNKENLKQKVLSRQAVIENNGTLKQLEEVLKYVFPEDKDNDCVEKYSDYVYFYTMTDDACKWDAHRVNYRKDVIEVTDFFKEEVTYPRQMLVKDFSYIEDKNIWQERTIEFERNGVYFHKFSTNTYTAYPSTDVKPLITEIPKEEIQRIFACKEFVIV